MMLWFAVVTCLVAGHTALPTCGAGFIPLIALPLTSVDEGFRMDFRVPDVRAGSQDIDVPDVVLDTTSDGLVTRETLPGSITFVPSNATDNVFVGGWGRMGVRADHSQDVAAILGVGGAALANWGSASVFTHPRGGWIVMGTDEIDPVGVLGRHPVVTPWLDCHPGATLCFVDGRIGDEDARVAFVPELRVVWVSGDREALDTISPSPHLDVTVGEAHIRVSYDALVGDMIRVVRVHPDLHGNDVIIGGAAATPVIVHIRPGSRRVAVSTNPRAVEHVMGNASATDIAMMLFLFVFVFLWATGTGTRGKRSPSGIETVYAGSITMLLALVAFAAEIDNGVFIPRMVLWTRCQVNATFSELVLQALNTVFTVSVVTELLHIIWSIRTRSRSRISRLVHRTTVVVAASTASTVLVFRLAGVGLENRSLVLVFLPLCVSIGVVARLVDWLTFLSGSPHTASSAQTAIVVGIFALNTVFIFGVTIFLVLPLQAVALSTVRMSDVEHAVLGVCCLGVLFWIAWVCVHK